MIVAKSPKLSRSWASTLFRRQLGYRSVGNRGAAKSNIGTTLGPIYLSPRIRVAMLTLACIPSKRTLVGGYRLASSCLIESRRTRTSHLYPTEMGFANPRPMLFRCLCQWPEQSRRLVNWGARGMGMGMGMSTSRAPWLRDVRGSIQHGPSPWAGYSPNVRAFEDTRSPDYKQIKKSSEQVPL